MLTHFCLLIFKYLAIRNSSVSSSKELAMHGTSETDSNSLQQTTLERRFIYPEFLPDPKMEWRNPIREKLERMDMLKRRSRIDIPEFYVGKFSPNIFFYVVF